MSHQFLTKRIFPPGFVHAALVALVACCISAPLAPAQQIKIANNTPGFIKHAVDLGPTDPTTDISATVWLQLHNEAQLDQLVQQQNQKGNANFHKWITQAQFNSMFGPTSQEVNAVSNYLSAKDLTVLTVAENNMYVKVEGTVAQMQKAFGVQIHNYKLSTGETHRSNTADPTVNDASGAHVAAISGLDDLGFQPAIAIPGSADGATFTTVPLTSGSNGLFFSNQCLQGQLTQTFTGATSFGPTTATYTGNRYGADITNTKLGTLAPCGYQPSEIHTAYDLNALYKQTDASSNPLNGAGETVVITDAFGSPTIASDAEVFSQLYKLPDITPDNFQILRAPGAVHNPGKGHFGGTGGWMVEISLDVEWIHATAPGAKIVLVIGPNNGADLDEAINYAVVHHLGNTISNSWGAPEGFGNPAHFIRDTRILQMAAALGIDVNFSSGDFGDFSPAIGFKSVNFPGSSPFATSIGGTSLFVNSDNTMNFQTGWGTNLTRVAKPAPSNNVPEDPPVKDPVFPLLLGFDGGSGGGTSLTFPKPAFQSSLPGTMRQVPDISWLADPFTGVEIVFQNGVGTVGGTSLASPMFSALMAIAAQKNGHVGLGQAAPRLYGLSSAAISDITPVSSPNNVTGTITDNKGTTTETAEALASPLATSTTPFMSALYNSPFSTRWFVITFGTDTSLTTATGWDNVTGLGTPNPADFVTEITK